MNQVEIEPLFMDQQLNLLAECVLKSEKSLISREMKGTSSVTLIQGYPFRTAKTRYAFDPSKLILF